MNETKALQEMLFHCLDFEPLLTKEQYRVYVKHLQLYHKLRERR